MSASLRVDHQLLAAPQPLFGAFELRHVGANAGVAGELAVENEWRDRRGEPRANAGGAVLTPLVVRAVAALEDSTRGFCDVVFREEPFERIAPARLRSRVAVQQRAVAIGCEDRIGTGFEYRLECRHQAHCATT